MEYINGKQVSPLISKGVCKVCYVGQQPNRNNTVITKEVATEMGRKLPGSPIVGYFDKEEEDFKGHEREIIVKGGKFEIIDITKPYGFVPTDANVWFQKFIDEGVEHEYLVTDVYIWTGAYPESQRIFDQGNNQSMELSSKNQNGFWTNDNNTNARVFIYNEALIEKLCILGENVEPCFEGAQIKAFSLSSPEFEEFKATMFSKIAELQEMFSKGGSQEPMLDNLENPEVKEEETPALENELIETPASEPEDMPSGENACGGAGGSTKKKDDEEEESENNENDDEKKKKKYNLEEVTEYTELLTKFEALQSDYATLQASNEALETEVAALKEFKVAADRKDKQAMIDSFYMLSDADKKDVIDNIDTYSLEDIEAKLSIICVRNKVNFNLEEEITTNNNANPQGLFNLEEAVNSDSAPAWIKAVRETAQKQ